MILRRVNLPGVSYCTESLMTPGSQQLFLKTFAQAFKGIVSQNQLWIHILLLRFEQSSRSELFFDSPGYDTPESPFFRT